MDVTAAGREDVADDSLRILLQQLVEVDDEGPRGEPDGTKQSTESTPLALGGEVDFFLRLILSGCGRFLGTTNSSLFRKPEILLGIWNYY